MTIPVGRKTLPHDSPSWVDPATSTYFITIACHRRGENQLCLLQIGPSLMDSARHYAAHGRWFPTIFLLMPDHLHMLATFGLRETMTQVVSAWKSFTAKKLPIHWQRGFFEHRLRADESLTEKAAYILDNPVRAGLTDASESWPYRWISAHSARSGDT